MKGPGLLHAPRARSNHLASVAGFGLRPGWDGKARLGCRVAAATGATVFAD